jgi:excisionase family DNA binding protein
MTVVSPPSAAAEAVEAYRKTELRLRLLLFGDGAETPPLVKGEGPRQRVTAEIRHLREAFDALSEAQAESHARVAEAASAMEQELSRRASVTTRPAATAEPDLLTAAEAAATLGMSASAVYRAIRRGDLEATRPTGTDRGPIRIPRAAVLSFLAARSG